MDSGSRTSLSLLMQLRNGVQKEEAWNVFVQRYGSRIYEWCLNRNLQHSDAEDVSQIVLLKLARALRTFDYDPDSSFRGWLRRITENALSDFFRDQKRKKQIRHYDLAGLELAEAREDLISRLESAYDLELFDKALDGVRQRVSENRFHVWELAAVKGLPAKDIAVRMKMKIATVYTAKNQVQSLLQDEVRKLERQLNTGKISDPAKF